jgi:hypothetical protein
MLFRQIKWFLAFLTVNMLMGGCGMHYTIQGKVLDSETRQPVAGAVVAIKWERYQFTPPGLPPNRTRYGTSESITDAQGQFSIPKYPFADHFMGVYKHGYVGWSSEEVYHPEGKTYEEKYVWREKRQVNDGMVIELVPIIHEGFPVLEHARFVNSIARYAQGTKFSIATTRELNLEWNAKPIEKKER